MAGIMHNTEGRAEPDSGCVLRRSVAAADKMQ
jgi:hypothetical protein